jgi:misacylated tRNA(Ala) deacylase
MARQLDFYEVKNFIQPIPLKSTNQTARYKKNPKTTNYKTCLLYTGERNMSKALFLGDSYLKESHANVVSVKDGRYVTLNQTIFYPKGGGQPYDTGKIIRETEVFNVVYVGRFQGEISHEVDRAGLQPGDKVHCILNWERRYELMRSHTAAHVLAALLNKSTGALITGNQLEENHTRFDFSLEKFDRPS